MIHLDTSFLIRALRSGSTEDRRLRAWLSEHVPLRISAVSWTEFLSGPVRAREIELAARIAPEPMSFTAEDSMIAAKLYNLGGRRRGSLVDCMIAASALRAGASLATSNATDFTRLESAGLRVISS